MGLDSILHGHLDQPVNTLNIDVWLSELKNDVDSEFLCNGLLNGFDIIKPESVLCEVFIQNHKSALEAGARERMDAIIIGEILEGNYIVTDTKPTIVSALGAVPKDDGDLRPIHDCSLPESTGLNAHAPEFPHQSYESVDSAVKMLKADYYMAKIDIRHAYRSIPISKQSCRATGLHWTFMNGSSVYMYDCKMPFGASASATIFHRISQAVKRMMARRGYDNLVAYQDDYLIIGSTYAECHAAWEEMQMLLKRLGFQLNASKLVPPTTCLTFLGIQINTKLCELSLPSDKLSALKTCIAEFAQKKRATKRQLQSLAGKLCFAARVVRGARLFLRRLFNTIASLKRQHHKANLRGAVREDILWWHTFMSTFNGVAAFMDEENIATVLTDACLYAGGAFHNGNVFYTVWTVDEPEAVDLCINYKETLIAARTLKRWSRDLKNRHVWLYTDNQCAFYALNKFTCKNEIVMQAMREMFWSCVNYNICIKACYVPGYLQDIPDAVSRFHEHNGLIRLETLINDWYKCHCFVKNAFQYFNLYNHMSPGALLCILEQVMAWRRVKFR